MTKCQQAAKSIIEWKWGGLSTLVLVQVVCVCDSRLGCAVKTL